MLASLRFNLVALSTISLLVGGVLVATTLATSVVQRRFVVSLLRSLGASRRRIAAVVLAAWEPAPAGVLEVRRQAGQVLADGADHLAGAPRRVGTLEPALAEGGRNLPQQLGVEAGVLDLPHHGGELPGCVAQRSLLTLLERPDGLEKLVIGFVEFPALFAIAEGRMGVVVTFMAVLELLKDGLIESDNNNGNGSGGS